MVAQKKKEKDPSADAAYLYERPICANCGKKITKYRVQKAKKEKWLPLCKECDIFIKDQLEKCKPHLKALFG